jgi:hypothetical protein
MARFIRRADVRHASAHAIGHRAATETPQQNIAPMEQATTVVASSVQALPSNAQGTIVRTASARERIERPQNTATSLPPRAARDREQS